MDVCIGRVIKSHGIRGEVVVDPTTDQPEVRFAVGEVLHGTQTGKTHELTIAHVRPHQQRLLITFQEVSDRTTADTLRGTKFFAPVLDDDDDEEGFYDHELEGLTVVCDGAKIGVVSEVTTGPGGTLLQVRLAADQREVLIPFVHAIVPEVDLEHSTVTITPPDGLLDL
ncbi:ribosome maturation factor RimM [Corynebacterium choanae]|uniref:Ribosome maturation factor RimM n=1 Tax=Corynebacterium choanae TaxID=1862358 RepID=A0A3G6J7L4_9CORY|nr:ribosome maturation factor RimM [Corynebacterium choanae]AZA13879.1 Ribosome maturation factor RimM [Corynebacterium choanae]